MYLKELRLGRSEKLGMLCAAKVNKYSFERLSLNAWH